MTEHDILIQKFVNNQLSTLEKVELQEWVLSNSKNLATFKQKIKEWDAEYQKSFNSKEAYKTFISSTRKRKTKTFTLKKYYKYVAILIISLSLSYYYFFYQVEPSSDIVQKNTLTKEEITITFADGSTKVINNDVIDDIKDNKGNVIASKNSNGFHFKTDEGKVTLTYNEVTVPNKKTLRLQLSDGTKVWLNSGTVFKFPQNFLANSKNRTVYLKGEAYFEVVTNKKKPFIIDSKGVQVEVLGTKFNVSSYENEQYITTTLVEGSLNVFETNIPEKGILLTPNLQARYHKTKRQFSKAHVDPRVYTSWINDVLIINSLTFNEILKKLERKYDVVIINKAVKLNSEVYRGEFKNETIETILQTITLSTPFTYTIDRNKITITE